MKVLLVRLSAIGDVVHTLPVLAALHERGHQVSWVVESAARPLLEGNPALSSVVPAPGAAGFAGAGAVLRRLRGEAYEVALDLQGLWKSAAWARLSGAPRVVGFAGPWRREPLSRILLRETAHPAEGPAHVIDKNLALLRALGIDAVGHREFPLPTSSAAAAAVEAGLASLELTDFVVLNPGGGWASKMWPAEYFGALAQGLELRGLRPLVTWGPGEERLADRVLAASGGTALRCFPTSLLEYIELVRRARLVVAADTGPLHLACAVQTPVVGVYGPTDPGRNGPFSPRDLTVRRLPLCAPCHRRRCEVHEGVMEAIMPAEVLAAVERRLGLSSGSGALAV